MLAIDHDHETGEVRGLLCSVCNISIGLLGDDLGRIEAAALYLESYGKCSISSHFEQRVGRSRLALLPLP